MATEVAILVLSDEIEEIESSLRTVLGGEKINIIFAPGEVDSLRAKTLVILLGEPSLASQAKTLFPDAILVGWHGEKNKKEEFEREGVTLFVSPKDVHVLRGKIEEALASKKSSPPAASSS